MMRYTGDSHLALIVIVICVCSDDSGRRAALQSGRLPWIIVIMLIVNLTCIMAVPYFRVTSHDDACDTSDMLRIAV